MGKSNGDSDVEREDPCEVSPCDDLQCRILIEEYRQWSEDWRLRDEYVERKFLSATFYITVSLGLIGWFFSGFRNVNNTSGASGSLAIALILFLVLTAYILFMLVSLVKDVNYRDGTRQMIIRVLQELKNKCKSMTSVDLIKDEEKHLTISIPPSVCEKGLVFPRKVAVHSRLALSPVFKWFPMKISTFNLFVVFHIVVLLGCTVIVGILIRVLVG